MVKKLTPTPEFSSEPPTLTLGALLHENSSRPRTPEGEWVALVQAIAQGDQRAFRDLYGRMHALVFTLITRIVHDRRTAEELTMDVFHDIWRDAGSYSTAGGPVVGWVMNRARSRAIDQFRYEHRKKRVDPFPDAAESSVEDNSARHLDERQRDRHLRAAVAQLTPNERNAIEMAFFADFTYEETAVRLHEPPGTVKTRIRSGLEKLRAVLASDVSP